MRFWVYLGLFTSCGLGLLCFGVIGFGSGGFGFFDGACIMFCIVNGVLCVITLLIICCLRFVLICLGVMSLVGDRWVLGRGWVLLL